MQKGTHQNISILKHGEITDKILAAFYAVYHALGYGFLEKVYQNALQIEIEKLGLAANHGVPISVYYAGQVVGEYIADLVVANLVIVEVKAVRVLLPEHEAQLLNYLKATEYEVGLLLNFGSKPEKLRRAFDNTRKEWWVALHPI